MKLKDINETEARFFSKAVGWIRKYPYLVFSVIALVLIIFFVFEIMIGHISWADWTGFGKYTGL